MINEEENKKFGTREDITQLKDLISALKSKGMIITPEFYNGEWRK